MPQVTLTRTGNTEAVALPKAIRAERGFRAGDRFEAFSPDEETVIFRRVRPDATTGLGRLLESAGEIARTHPVATSLHDDALVSDVRTTLEGRGRAC